MSSQTKAQQSVTRVNASRPRIVLRDSINGIKRPPIKRLAHRAGIPRVSGSLYDPIRAIIRTGLEEIINQAVIAVKHTRSKTIKTKHLEFALHALRPGASFGAFYEKSDLGSKAETHRKTHGESTTQAGSQTKKHKFRAGVEALRDINRMQNSEDLILSNHPFNHLVREITQDYGDDLRFQARAIGLLRLYIETHVLDILRVSLIVAIHAGRETVMPKDITIALAYMQMNV